MSCIAPSVWRFLSWFFPSQERFSSRISVISRPPDCDTATLRGAAQYGLAGRALVSSVIAPQSYMMKVSGNKCPVCCENPLRGTAVSCPHVIASLKASFLLTFLCRSNCLLSQKTNSNDPRTSEQMTLVFPFARIGKWRHGNLAFSKALSLFSAHMLPICCPHTKLGFSISSPRARY